MKTPTPAAAPNTKLQKFWNGIVSALPVIVLVGSIICAVFSGAFNYYGSQTAQAQTIKELQEGQKLITKTMDDRKAERDKQFDALQKQILTKELYDAYHKGDIERMERMEKMLERLLEK